MNIACFHGLLLNVIKLFGISVGNFKKRDLYMTVSDCARVYAEEVAGLQCMKRILGKVQEMREQRGSLEKQLRDLIQTDDITSTLVTTERADMKVFGKKRHL